MLSDVQEKILIKERKELLDCIKQRDEVIEFLLDTLEDEHLGSRAICCKEISERWNLYY